MLQRSLCFAFVAVVKRRVVGTGRPKVRAILFISWLIECCAVGFGVVVGGSIVGFMGDALGVGLGVGVWVVGCCVVVASVVVGELVVGFIGGGMVVGGGVVVVGK